MSCIATIDNMTKLPTAFILLAALTACSPATTQDANIRRAMQEHNDVSLDLQKVWGSKPRNEAETQAQRAWEASLQQTCHNNAQGKPPQLGEDLNAVYCEINAMQERKQALLSR